MNRGRHKKISIPYGNFITIRIFFKINHHEEIYSDCARIIKNEKQLNNYISSYLRDSYFNTTKIEVIYKHKILKTYVNNNKY